MKRVIGHRFPAWCKTASRPESAGLDCLCFKGRLCDLNAIHKYVGIEVRRMIGAWEKKGGKLDMWRSKTIALFESGLGCACKHRRRGVTAPEEVR
jgi:hypothetical protein